MHERPVFKFQDDWGDLKLQSQLNYYRGLLSAACLEQDWAGAFSVWAGRGQAGGLVVRLLLQREGKLVRRQSSAHGGKTPPLGCGGWRRVLFPFCSALLVLSALRFIHSGSGRLGPCPMAGWLRWKGLLFVVLPAQGWLTSCPQNLLETFLFSLTSDCKASSEAICDASYKNCVVLPVHLACITSFHPSCATGHWSAAFISARAACAKRRVHASSALIRGRSKAAEKLQAGAGVWRQRCRCAVVCVGSECSLLALTGFLSQMLKPVTAKEKKKENDKHE